MVPRIVFLLVTLLATTAIAAEKATCHIYLLAGQSNMDGRGKVKNLTDEQRQPLENMQIFYRNMPHSSEHWRPLEPGYSVAPGYKGSLPSPTFGPEMGFAFAYREAHPDQMCGFIKGSKGGSSLRTDWKIGEAGKPETQGQRYRDFIETIRMAKEEMKQNGQPFEIKGLLWHQGESDASLPAAEYETLLKNFIARIRKDTGIENLPVVVGEVFDNEKRDRVREALKTVGTNEPHCGFVSAEGTTTWDNGTHFDAASQLLLGKRYFEEMEKLTSEKD